MGFRLGFGPAVELVDSVLHMFKHQVVGAVGIAGTDGAENQGVIIDTVSVTEKGTQLRMVFASSKSSIERYPSCVPNKI